MVKPVSPCFRHGETPITNKMEHTLILTDKPEVGKTIARIIGADKRGNGYMAGGGYIVTWTFGNMLSLAMPKDYGKARVERKDFPLVPRPFQLMVKHVRTDSGWIPDINAVKQLKVIEKLLPECSRIIAATDARARVNCCSGSFTDIWDAACRYSASGFPRLRSRRCARA